ncbi:MAG: type II secretion system protein [Candidatus Omnitrophica bacterium]|nr:type II secretion system protein [Candidatus Omnitrophota bacterium]
MMRRNKGFILLLVLASMAILILAGTTLINIGTSEMGQARRDTDHMNAYCGAVSGAERLYAHLKSQRNQNIDWANQVSSGTVTAAGKTLATYNAAAYPISYNSAAKTGVLGIISTGISGGATSRITVKYGYTATSIGPAPVSSAGNIVLTGHLDDSNKKNPKSSSVYIEGPLLAGPGGTVTINGPTNLVTVNGGSQNNVGGISDLSFWLNEPFNTKGTSYVFSDADASGNPLGYVTKAMAEAQAGTTDKTDSKLATFYTNDINGDLVIDEKDAFIYYYTQYLDQANNLDIAPGEINYFSPVTTPASFKDHINVHGKRVKLLDIDTSSQLNKRAVPKGTEIIFVDGDLFINKTDTKWKGGAFTHTIVCTGNVDIFQPTNDANDTLAVVALGDVTICGRDTGNSQLKGNFIVYTAGNFTALMGGTSHNAIFAEGTVTIDTVDANKKNDRTMYNLLGTWTPPMGLPPGYRTIYFNFALDTSVYKTEWEMTGN